MGLKYMLCYIITSTAKGDGRLFSLALVCVCCACACMCPHMHAYIHTYVCEQLPDANSSLIVTKLCQSYPLGRSKVKVGVGGMRFTERLSIYRLEEPIL